MKDNETPATGQAASQKSAQRKHLTAMKLTAITRAAGDRRLTDFECRLLLLLLPYISDKPDDTFGKIWPSQALLANTSGANRRTVQRAIDQLADVGYLVECQRGGRFRGDKSYYRLADFTARQANKGGAGTAHNADKGGSRTALKSGMGGPGDAYGRSYDPGMGGSRTAHTLYQECSTNNALKNGADVSSTAEQEHDSRPSQELRAAFRQFWAAYPRKSGRDHAEREFIEAVTSGRATAAELIKGAQTYASNQMGEDPRYTLGAQRWLQEEHWRGIVNFGTYIDPRLG